MTILMQCVYDIIIWCGPTSFHSRIGAKLAKCPEGMYKQDKDNFKREEYQILICPSHLRVPLTRLRTISTQRELLRRSTSSTLSVSRGESLLWGGPAMLHCNCWRWNPFIVPQWHCRLYGQKRIYRALILHKAFPYNSLMLWLCQGPSKESYIHSMTCYLLNWLGILLCLDQCYDYLNITLLLLLSKARVVKGAIEIFSLFPRVCGEAWGQLFKLVFDTKDNDRSTIHNHSAWSVGYVTRSRLNGI